MHVLETIVRQKLKDAPKDFSEPFFSHLRASVKEKSCAILAYGSCLSQVTKTETSAPDFFVLVDRYKTFYSSWLHRGLNHILPPNIYHFTINKHTAKYNVISIPALNKHTSKNAKDSYLVGRFSKRMALLFSKDDRTEDEVVMAQARAMRTAAKRTYPLLPKFFSLQDFAKASIRLSYLGDVRVEANDKIDRIFTAEKEFYEQAYETILEEMKEAPFYLQSGQTPQTYEKVSKGFSDAVDRWKTKLFLSRSRLRAQLRWPKGIFTVDNWIDYLIHKIERTKGITIELTPKQRKYWYIFGWKVFFSLRKQKLIK